MARVLHQPATAAPTVVVTVAPVADQLTLATISPTVSATSNAVAATITAYAWTVSGPATIANETTATPTITPTGGGVIGIACAATVGGIVYRSAVETLTVGIAAADGGHWVVDWELDPATAADHNFKAGALTHDGVTLTLSGTATKADIASGVWTMHPTGASDIYLYWTGDEPSAKLGRDVCWMIAFGANLTADNDGIFMLYGNSATSVYGFAEARRISGTQRINIERAGSIGNYDTTAGGGQARVLGHRLAGGYMQQCVYSETALGASWPDPSSMSKHDRVPSGWYSLDDIATSETADTLAPATDAPRVQFRGNNGRIYTVTRMARLVKM